MLFEKKKKTLQNKLVITSVAKGVVEKLFFKFHKIGTIITAPHIFYGSRDFSAF